MEIKEIDNKVIWENFLAKCEDKTFLDSWNWGEFQEKEKNKIWRLGIFDIDKLVAIALVIKVEAKRGTFLFIPHAPVAKKGIDNKNLLSILLGKLKEIGRQEKADFIRLAPICGRTEENAKIYKYLGFKTAPIHIHPEVTWELNITPPEEGILAGMRKTTRYLIKQAQKNQDIEITKSNNISDLESFEKIYLETAKRHNFFAFSSEYIKNEFSVFDKDKEILIFLGKYQNKVVSAAIFVFWQGTAFYHHSGSLTEYSKIPVSYLLQWEAIKEAKTRGCGKYNFWGVVDSNKEEKNHPWWGLTQFKMGFGGEKKEYVKTQDYPLSFKYNLIYLFEKIRKAKRRL